MMIADRPRVERADPDNLIGGDGTAPGCGVKDASSLVFHIGTTIGSINT